ncbi:MAG: PIG-L family deacetylase [Acidobacteriota bacterium]|nr:PIG-L family deacetylase [Acidobacteriota bacterium]MDE3043972.1 PIG-L family deacetylase [Acidobacteriota bacterium]
MTPTNSLVFVHAHPDDESLFGAGAARHYADAGARVTLVTCTLGQLGLDQEARPGEAPDHDDLTTAATRAGELVRAARLLGFSRTINLGYLDSGMAGWPQNEDPRAFVNADVSSCARVLAAVFDEVGARVVVTYDENGFYGHPDHVAANVVTRRAVELSASVERLYYPVVPREVLADFVEGARALGVYLPAWVVEAGTHVPRSLVNATLDVRALAAVKQRAMATHASQVDNGDLVEMRADLFSLLFGTEYFQRAWSRSPVGEGADETDLFGGLTWD